MPDGPLPAYGPNLNSIVFLIHLMRAVHRAEKFSTKHLLSIELPVFRSALKVRMYRIATASVGYPQILPKLLIFLL